MLELEISQLCLRYAETRIRKASWRARLGAAIAQQGQLSPVLVHRDGEQFVLIDGYARVEALQNLGRDHVLAIILEMSPADALLTRQRLRGGRAPSAIEEGWLLQILMEEHGLRVRDLAPKLERSASWVSRRLALVSVLPERVQTAIRRGDLCPQAAMKSLVPLARANADHCERLVVALTGHSPSVRDLGRIYDAWRSADASVRERIVDRPQLLLQTLEATTTPRSNRPAIEGLLELRRQAQRVVGLIQAPPSVHELDRVRDEWSRTCHAFDALAARMDAYHARRRDSADHPATLQDGAECPRHLEDPTPIS